jgi:hypothetical protein
MPGGKSQHNDKQHKKPHALGPKMTAVHGWDILAGMGQE